ncbi:MAG TPA: glycerol-3-phosphate dehydrogenase/oxidase [Rhizomicrobium sp.]|jgi:glycerol-3-phosphate dehydrogenase|nr:glycerol-3-phosphate dehydrogenase/oxidase [Rhizomicrobium sp.]
MRRDLLRLANETFDLLIIGGGVTGACVARDAALRGLSVALIEKGDFANATSAHNSKLIHGGLRYLRNFELGLVRESLRERRIWQRIAPHLVQPLPFLVPLYDAGFKERAMLSAGLNLYDLLSFDRARLDDPDERLPGHHWLDKRRALAEEPMLDAPGFEGSFRYYDAQMYSPERLALENILDASLNSAAVANYVAAERLSIRNGRIEGAQVREAFGGGDFEIRAKLTLLAAGPWADLFLNQALGKPTAHKLLRSKGIHLVVPPMTKTDALTVAAGAAHFFVLPWRGYSLLGTTDTQFLGAPDDVGVTESDVDGFLGFINGHLPSAHLKRGDVRHFYAGLRPLVDDGSGDTYDASRRAELIDHGKDDGADGLFSAIGGKWTTSRDLAETVTDTIAKKLGQRVRGCTTGTTRLPGGSIPRRREFFAALAKAYPNIATGHLGRLYGTRLSEVIAEAGNRTELLSAIAPTGDIGAQVLFAMREEMAMSLSDVVMRRTGIGQLGDPGDAALQSTAALMAQELGWDDARRAREIAAVQTNFRLAP